MRRQAMGVIRSRSPHRADRGISCSSNTRTREMGTSATISASITGTRSVAMALASRTRPQMSIARLPPRIARRSSRLRQMAFLIPPALPRVLVPYSAEAKGRVVFGSPVESGGQCVGWPLGARFFRSPVGETHTLLCLHPWTRYAGFRPWLEPGFTGEFKTYVHILRKGVGGCRIDNAFAQRLLLDGHRTAAGLRMKYYVHHDNRISKHSHVHVTFP